MYQGKDKIRAVQFKLPKGEEFCTEMEELLNHPRKNVLSVSYAHNGNRGEKWALVIYEER